MDNDKLYQLALHFTPGIGHYTIKQLISYCGSAKNVFEQKKGKLQKIPGIGPGVIKALSSESQLKIAEKELWIAESQNIQILSYTDKAFPQRLKSLNDAPAIIYFKGNTDLNTAKCIAVVGTRRATDYGKHFTEELIESVAVHSPLIISGLAYGIDITAHRAALRNNLPTIGVMGSGIDIIYPAIHRKTASEMIENGGLLSEIKIGIKPEPSFFPARNRIIAGMADAVIVVEAAKKGGALITAEIGNTYNKDVFALPGNVGNPYSEGCNNLIKAHKAHMLSSLADLEYIMNWEKDEKTDNTSKKISQEFDGEERVVVDSLIDRTEGLLLDELCWQTNIPLSKLASILLNLEFKGAVSSLPGKRYKLS